MHATPDDVLDEMISWIYNEPGNGDPTPEDVAWARDFALRRAELDEVLETLPRTLERADGRAAVSSITHSVLTALRRYCAVGRAEAVPFPDCEKVVLMRDAYALTLYLSVMTLHELGKAPTDAAASRLARLRHQIANYVEG